MNRLTSYIVRVVLKSTAYVAIVLVAVASVIELVGQFDDVGLGSYGLSDALAYVALRIPHKLFDVLPAAALIGSLLGLGNMAVHRELVVMRVSGLSQYRLLGAVGAAGVILLVLMLLLGESLAPKLGSYARQSRADALIDGVDQASDRSTWIQEGSYIVNLFESEDDELYGQQVRVFEFDGGSGLARVIQGELLSGDAASQTWDFVELAETSFTSTGVIARREYRASEDFGFSRQVLEFSESREDLLELQELRSRIESFQERGLDVDRLVAAYWGRIASAVSVMLMAMLALPFVLGSLRSAGAGARMIIGLTIGLGYYVLGDLSVNVSEVFALDPMAAAWAPAAVLAVVTGAAVVRLR